MTDAVARVPLVCLKCNHPFADAVEQAWGLHDACRADWQGRQEARIQQPGERAYNIRRADARPATAY